MAIMEVFSLDAVRVNLAYLDQLKKLFVDRLHLNFNVGKKAVNWHDVEEKNIPMIARSFLKLCRHNYLIPHLFNIEALQMYIEQTLPAITNGEQEFYDKNMLIQAYNDDSNPDSPIGGPLVNETTGEQMEPALHFHEFIFLLGLIAKKSITSTDGLISSQLEEFYVNKLAFKPIKQSKESDLTYDQVLNRVAAGDDEYGSYGDSGDEDEWGESSGSEEGAAAGFSGAKPARRKRTDTYEKAVQELIEQKNQEEMAINIDWDQLT